MVVVFGSINLDLVTRVERFPRPGETVAGRSFASYPGGKGANQALACARAGATVHLHGAVGRDAFAAESLMLLQQGGVDLDGVARVDAPTGCATILVSAEGENCIAVVAGANALADPGLVPDAMLDATTVVVLQNEVPQVANAALAARAQRRHARVILNAAPARPLPLDLLRQFDVLVVNESEATALAEEHGWPHDRIQFLHAVGEAMPDLCVVVTLGKDGAMAAGASLRIRIEAPAITTVDTTGAGDAFVGVLAAMLEAGSALPDALRSAVAAGTLACTRAGAQPALPDRAAIDALACKLQMKSNSLH